MLPSPAAGLGTAPAPFTTADIAAAVVGTYASKLRESYASMTLDGNNQTKSQVMFTITGVVDILALFGVVTTVLGSNLTDCHIRTNDQTANIDLSLNTGLTLSSLVAGSAIYKNDLLTAILLKKDAAVGFVRENSVAGGPLYQQFGIGKKNGATTTLDFRYSTTNTPTSGVIRWGALWVPISSDGNLA